MTISFQIAINVVLLVCLINRDERCMSIFGDWNPLSMLNNIEIYKLLKFSGILERYNSTRIHYIRSFFDEFNRRQKLQKYIMRLTKKSNTIFREFSHYKITLNSEFGPSLINNTLPFYSLVQMICFYDYGLLLFEKHQVRNVWQYFHSLKSFDQMVMEHQNFSMPNDEFFKLIGKKICIIKYLMYTKKMSEIIFGNLKHGPNYQNVKCFRKYIKHENQNEFFFANSLSKTLQLIDCVEKLNVKYKIADIKYENVNNLFGISNNKFDKSLFFKKHLCCIWMDMNVTSVLLNENEWPKFVNPTERLNNKNKIVRLVGLQGAKFRDAISQTLMERYLDNANLFGVLAIVNYLKMCNQIGLIKEFIESFQMMSQGSMILFFTSCVAWFAFTDFWYQLDENSIDFEQDKPFYKFVNFLYKYIFDGHFDQILNLLGICKIGLKFYEQRFNTTLKHNLNIPLIKEYIKDIQSRKLTEQLNGTLAFKFGNSGELELVHVLKIPELEVVNSGVYTDNDDAASFNEN